MDKPPLDWIEKLFDCMEVFYGNRWTTQCAKHYIGLRKTLWQSALQGLTHDEIRNVLVYLKPLSRNPWEKPPGHLEFYQLAKTRLQPLTHISDEKKPNSEIASKHLAQIRKILHISVLPNITRETYNAPICE